MHCIWHAQPNYTFFKIIELKYCILILNMIGLEKEIGNIFQQTFTCFNDALNIFVSIDAVTHLGICYMYCLH